MALLRIVLLCALWCAGLCSATETQLPQLRALMKKKNRCEFNKKNKSHPFNEVVADPAKRVSVMTGLERPYFSKEFIGAAFNYVHMVSNSTPPQYNETAVYQYINGTGI
eukprot:gene5070-15303_t